VHLQDGLSCLFAASSAGHLEVVKYLSELGGEELMMLRTKVSDYIHT
jgi:hypothetical protein